MFFKQPKISLGVFLLFIILSVCVVWLAATIGGREQRSNLSIVHRIGEQVKTDTLIFSVESVRRDEIGAGPLTPRTGYEFIVPTITLKNTSETSFNFIPLLYLHVKDSAGNVYNVVAIPSESNQLSGPILPHDVIREEIGFEVAKGAEGLTLHFDPGTHDQKSVVFDLNLN